MRFLVSILLTVLLAFGLGFYLAVPANPEVKFWSAVVKARDDEMKQVRSEHPGQPIIAFTGGSSTAFSIDPAIIERHGRISAFNLALPVAAGPEYLVHQAMDRLRPGDLLVVSLEPDLLCADDPETSPSKFSFAMAFADGKTTQAAGGDTFGNYPGLRDYLSLPRPGAGYLATLIARKMTGSEYRYRVADMRYRGRVETPVRAAVPVAGHPRRALSGYGKEFLRRVKSQAGSRGLRVAYSLPWQLVDESSLGDSRANNRALLEEIGMILPVLHDPSCGAAADASWFSDSPQHLTAEGSRLRSIELAEAILTWVSSNR